MARAFSSGRRAEIVEVLAQGERSVDDLAAAIEQTVANTSHHLRALARSGLVTTRRDGTRVYYTLASERVSELWAALREVAADHIAGLDHLADAYLGDRSTVAVIPRSELARRLGDTDIVVLDVRPRVEYDAGHIAGAESIPVDQLPGRVRSLRGDAEVVAYCRGPYCVYADDAVRLLRRRGSRARRLEDGFPEWRRAGLPVEGPGRAEEGG